MTDDEIQARIDDANDEARKIAQDEFTCATGAELQKQCHRLTAETANRYARIMKGQSPQAFGEYDRDDIARILNANVIIFYFGYELNMSADPDTVEDWQDGTNDAGYDTEAEEAWDRLAFVEAFEKYLYTAAAFAKSIGGVHAMRHYLRAWGIVHEARERLKVRFRLDPAEALRVVNLERVATDRLWVDVEAAKLPDFRRTFGLKGRSQPAKTRKGKR